jgi:hypothetical protein
LGVGLTTLPRKKKIVEKPPKIQPDNGRRLWKRPRPKLGCGAKERESEKWEVSETGPGSCPVVSFVIRGIEPSGSVATARLLVGNVWRATAYNALAIAEYLVTRIVSISVLWPT